MSSYSLVYNSSPLSYPSFADSVSDGLECSVASYTSFSNDYNEGYINDDPIYTHIQSTVKAQINYRLQHNGPKVVEASV